MSRLHILLLVLKIIGIFILILLGILLTLLLLVLFVPIRYRIDGEKEIQKDIKGNFCLSWLLHILSIHVLMDEGISASVKIFGISVFSKKSYESKKFQEKSWKNSETKKTTKSSDLSVSKKKEKSFDTDTRNTIGEHAIFTNEFNSETKEEEKDELKKFFPANIQRKKKVKKQNQQQRNKKNIFYKIWEKIIWFWSELKRKYYQILSFLKNLRYYYTGFLDKKEIFVQAWQNKVNRKGICFLWTTIKKLMNHIAPKKWTGYIHFGTNSPENTGKILGLIGVFGGIIGILPEIQPDFEKKVLEGKITVKGRIYIFYLIQLFIQVWKKKEVYGLIENVKKVWEELSWQKTI